MIKNNGFTRDGDEDRLERLLALSANIDTYADELSVEGDGISPAEANPVGLSTSSAA